MNFDKKQLRNTLLLLLGALIWGTAFVAQSVGSGYVGPYTFLAARSWLACAFLIVLVLLRRGKARTLRAGITKAERERYRELLKILDLGLENRLTSKVGLLSGGQRQALTLLMATLQRPKLLLLDEHTAALDPKTAAKVLDTTEKIVQRDKLTTLMITHNMRDAIAHGNRLIMMYEGRIAIDVAGEAKKKLTVEGLLEMFSKVSGSTEADDKLLLS